jgi:hypothetical protein
MLRKRIIRRRAGRRFGVLKSASRFHIEALEQRMMLSAATPAVTPPLPPLPRQPEPLQGVVGTPNSLDPQLFNDAYYFNDLVYNVNGVLISANGADQTIAIVDAYGSPTIVNDVETFDAQWGISNSDAEGNFFLTVQKLGRSQNTETDTQAVIDSWSSETSLDVEWAHAVAPGAHILLVEAPSQSLGDLLLANVYAAEQPGVVAVSNSWGYPISDFPQPLDGEEITEPATLDGYLVTPNAHTDNDGLTNAGVVFLASSGDTFNEDNFPAASANVLSVGGDSITVGLNGVIQNLGPWDGPVPEGSGGGNSTTAPTYNNPLVSIDADPETGVWIYDSTPDPADDAGPGWGIIGGTSLSCPVWAGVVALVDQGLQYRGIASLDSDQFIGYDSYDPDRIIGSTGDIALATGGTPAVVGEPLTATGILGLAETSIDTWDDLVELPPGVNANDFPLWPNTVTNGVDNPTGAYPSVTATPTKDNTGWGYPNLDNPGSPRGGFVQDMVGGAVGFSELDLGFDHLYFTGQPVNAIAGVSMPAIQVSAFNPATDTIDTTFNGQVQIAIEESGTLLGTVAVNAVNGVATFTTLSLDKTGEYVFQVSGSGVVPTTSNAFNVNAAVTSKLVITRQPASFWQNGVMASPMIVSLQDQFGNLETNISNYSVVLRQTSGPAGGLVYGNLASTVINGVAVFPSLTATKPGSYTLTAYLGNITPVTSSPFAEVPIPYITTHSLSGAPLSAEALAFQQERDAVVFTSEGPPSPVQTDIILAENNESILLASLEASTATRSFAAATYGAKESVSPLFASGGSNMEAQLLDIIELEHLL